MANLKILIGTLTKAGFPQHRALDSRCVLVDSNGGVWICSGGPAPHGLKPADPEELAALESHFGSTWRDAVTGMKALS